LLLRCLLMLLELAAGPAENHALAASAPPALLPPA
jgi:hypothetical protein